MLLTHILEAFLHGDFSSLWPPLAAVLTGAYKELAKDYQKLQDKYDPYKQATQEMKDDLEKWLKDKYDDIVPSQMERIREDVQNLLDETKKWGDNVVKDIANTVNQGLDSGVIAPQTDGGLGETRDIFTPDGQMPMDVGTMPGMSSDGGGLDRSGGASSGSGSSGSGPSSTSPSGNTQPLGTGSTPPTAGEVGASPGDFVEYQPGQGQVVITHPDGSQTIKPWPP